MAETWKIYPGGGGDYTDLQTAENAKDGDLSGRGVVSFECDNSGDCGEVLIAAWTNGDSSNYVRIAAETGSEHDGTNATTGAYITCANGNYGIDIQNPYVRVERMQINVAHGAASSRGISLEGVGTDSTIDGCLIRLTGSPGAGLLYGIYYSSVAADSGSTVRNCIMYGQKSATTERGIASFSVAAATWTRYYYNNSIYNMGQYGIRLYISNAGATLNVTATNNVSSGASIDFYDQSIAGTRNITSTYNVSTDATATDATWNGVGCVSGQAAAALFDTPGTNVTPKSAGPLENAGATIGSFSTDAIGTSRPPGAWDIGAIERIVAMAAEIYIWNGATDTDWTAAGGSNWETESGAAQGANQYPGLAAGDEAWFIGTVPSGATITAGPVGVDLSAAADLGSIRVADDYAFGIGTNAGTPVIVDMETNNETICIIDAASITDGIYFAGGGTNGLYRVVVANGKSAQDVWLSGKLGATHLLKGEQILYDGAVSACTSLLIGSVNNPSSDAKVTIEASATVPSIIRCAGGQVTNNVAVTTLQISGGEWTQAAGNIATITSTGGRVVWNAGNITTINLNGGEIDASREHTYRTVTTVVGLSGTLNVNDGIGTVTVTDWQDLGATINTFPGQRLTPYTT